MNLIFLSIFEEFQNLDVLILTDPIDDFWIPQLPEYNGKKFVSISRGKVNLDDIKTKKKNTKKGKDKVTLKKAPWDKKEEVQEASE